MRTLQVPRCVPSPGTVAYSRWRGAAMNSSAWLPVSKTHHCREDHSRRLVRFREKWEMPGAEADDARIDPSGGLALQGGCKQTILVGNAIPGRPRMPGGVCDAIEKCAGSNGLLRGGEDRSLSRRQVMRQKLQYCLRRKVEKPAGVYREAACDSTRATVPLSISRRLADVRRARRDVDECRNRLVSSGLRDDRASIVMADEHDRMCLMIERPRHGVDIVRECSQRILHRHDPQALGLEQCNDLAPVCRVGPGAMGNDDRRSSEVTRHGVRIRVTSAPTSRRRLSLAVPAQPVR